MLARRTHSTANPMNTRIPRLGLFFATLLSLLPLAGEAALAQERGLVVRVERRPIVRVGPEQNTPRAFEVEFEVFSNRRAVRGGVEMRLTAREMASIRRLVNRTRFRMEQRPVPVCTGFPSHDVRVSNARRSLVFHHPCSQPPDETVEAMMTGVREVLGRTPVVSPAPPPEPVVDPAPVPPVVTPPAPASIVLARYLEDRHDVMDGISIVLFDDGRLVFGTQTVQLAPDVFASLRARVRSVSFTRDSRPPTPCAAASLGSATLDVPGIGAATWGVPCGQPSTSVAELATTLRRLRLQAGEPPPR
jgi:hypothetical protein